MDRCYKRKYRQKIWSLKEVTIKGQIVTLYPVTSTRTLRYIVFNLMCNIFSNGHNHNAYSNALDGFVDVEDDEMIRKTKLPMRKTMLLMKKTLMRKTLLLMKTLLFMRKKLC